MKGIESQQQLISMNAGTAKIAFTATTRSFGQGGLNAPEDILLVMTNGVGQFDAQDGNCIDSIIVPAYTSYLTNNTINLAVTTPTILNTNPSPPLFDPNVVPEVVCGDTLQSCWAASDPDYVKIITPTTFNSGTNPSGVETWTGKYYIGADITIDGIVLDVTETDVVFAPCTRVTFTNGARLRANNSTFRPCEESESWEGLYFTPTGAGSSGVVNECIFKNAVDAISMQAGTVPGLNVTYDLRITNNLFMNCLRGVSLPGSNGILAWEGITGNTFTVDDREITWGLSNNTGVCSTFHSKAYTGIHATKGTFMANVSQNDFMNTSDSTSTSLTGIFWTQCSGRISLNNFTNNLHAVQFAQCSYSSVENNRIELNQLFTAHQTQILASNSQMIWVLGNHAVNSTEAGQYNPLGAAISMESCTSANVKENDIDGFSNGIQLINSTNSAINENHVTNANIVGVVVDGGTQDTVSCNEIKMRLRRNNSPVNEGIFYRHTTTNQDPSVKIKSNCVTDATYAVILANSTPTTRRVPRMHNNFLYNYTVNGVLSLGFNGSQGSGIANSAQAGRNTFVSNNIAGGAIDVNTSGQSQTWYGNYGISTISPGVTLVGNNAYSSIASCGLQIGTVSSTIGALEICDVFMSNVDGSMVRLMNGDFSEFEQPSDPAAFVSRAGDLIGLLLQRGEVDAAKRFHDFIAGNAAYSAGDRAWVDYQFHNQQDDAAAALAALAAWEGATAGSHDFATVQRIQQNLRLAGGSYADLSAAELQELKRIDESRLGQAADDARDLLHAAIGGYPHILKAVPVLDLPEATRALDVLNRNISLHPNPAHSRVTVDYALAQLGAGSVLRVHDLTGRVLLERNMDVDATSLEIEVEGWRPGIYLVSVLDANGKSLTAKLQVL
ncbi:MAG: T9SS type A sorting domain-containing protein [Bacteroidia bacterium]